ncbi:MAG: class I SAM-dependent methyltransferase, partial [Candidatus Omnitrophica bacterium]|nr:class I SAM-dependent methyltransferase [Candidatus Omnitrophota bacterium]
AVDHFDVRSRITLHQAYSENFDQELPKIGVLFYDGNHDHGFTYESLVKFTPFLADEALIIVDDYEIVGGNDQKPYEGYGPHPKPVKSDVDRWLRENEQSSLVQITPWTHQQAIIAFKR